MITFIRKILLEEKIEFNGSIEELKRKLNEPKGRKYIVKWISNNEFKFLSKWSLGTINTSGFGVVDGIKGYGVIESNKISDKIEIQLMTKLRIELYFITGMFILAFITLFFMKEKLPSGIYSLLAITLIWLWGIYRIQEYFLFRRIKNHLKN